MKKNSKNIFTQNNLLQIASYFLIFAILSNLIYIPCYFYIQNINRKNIIDSQQYQLENGMQMLDASMDALFNLPNILDTNTDYWITYSDRSDFNDQNLDHIRQSVNATLLPFDFITDSGLTLGNSILFTKHRIYYEKEALSYPLYFSCERENYLDEFTGSHCALPAALFSSINKEDYEAITIGLLWQHHNDTYFFVHYSLEDFFALFVNNKVLDYSHLSVYSGNTLLAEYGEPFNQDYITLTAHGNNQLDIQVNLHLSNSYVEQNLASMTQLIRIFITIVLIAAILWIIIFSLALSKPYRSISDALYNTGYLSTDFTAKSFTDTLVAGITRMGNQLSDYEQILKIQRERSRIHIFEKAIYRGLYGEESQKAFYSAFPDFPEKWQLVQLQYASDNDEMTFHTMQPILIQHLEKHISNLFVLSPNEDTLLVLLPLTPERQIAEELKKLCDIIHQQYGFSISIAFSREYDNPTFLVDAFHELESDEFSILPQSKTYCISMQQLQTIHYALLCGDVKTAISALKNSADKILANNDPFTAKISYRMLGYTLVQLKLENNHIKDIPIPAFCHDNLHKLFEEDFPACFHLVAEQLKQQNVEQTKKLDQDILDFIQHNLTNQQLGVALAAEQFHISPPTLQKRMNACTGKSFSAYVEAVRMEKAQQMLRDTSATVQEIAEAVGYINANSFYKAYKRCFGEPPLTYRQRIHEH